MYVYKAKQTLCSPRPFTNVVKCGAVELHMSTYVLAYASLYLPPPQYTTHHCRQCMCIILCAVPSDG